MAPPAFELRLFTSRVHSSSLLGVNFSKWILTHTSLTLWNKPCWLLDPLPFTLQLLFAWALHTYICMDIKKISRICWLAFNYYLLYYNHFMLYDISLFIIIQDIRQVFSVDFFVLPFYTNLSHIYQSNTIIINNFFTFKKKTNKVSTITEVLGRNKVNKNQVL